VARAEQNGITEAEAQEALSQLDPLWDELMPAEQSQVVQLTIERADIRCAESRSGCGRTASRAGA
jgi:hypothetical protein